MLEVVTVFAPRPGQFPEWLDWREYLPMLALQRATVEHFGHTHTVISDCNLDGLRVMHADLPESLMALQLAGQISFLEQWSGKHRVVLVDADCLINRKLGDAFQLFGRWDLGLTARPDHASSKINNGAMYVSPGAKDRVLRFFREAQKLCLPHWGGDQEAISIAAAPVLEPGTVVYRHNCAIGFLKMLTHNCTPKVEGGKHHSSPYVIHFKGKERKPWMQTYADKFILGGAGGDR